MSFQDCFSKSADTCNAPCVLEYQADTNGGNPTCVPPASLISRLSDEDVSILKQVLINLLPDVPSRVFATVIQNVRNDLGEYVEDKVLNAAKTRRYASWKEAVVGISQELIMEIRALNNPGCAVCLEPMNDLHSNTTVHTTPCKHVYHSHCYNYRDLRGKCPMCNKALPAEPGDIRQRWQTPLWWVEPDEETLEAERLAREVENEFNRQEIEMELRASETKKLLSVFAIFIMALLSAIAGTSLISNAEDI